MSKKKKIIASILVLILGVLFLLFSPFYNNEEIQDQMPIEMVSESNIFPIMGTFGHPASGHVRVLKTEMGTIIRYENFDTIAGPRLHVYLAKDLNAKEFVDLGPINGTSGNINYAVPSNIHLEDYIYVM
mgnify:CR=1 FL=1